jgi:hypothetical protein
MKGELSLTLRRVLKMSDRLPTLKGKAKKFILERATEAQKGSRGRVTPHHGLLPPPRKETVLIV